MISSFNHMQVQFIRGGGSQWHPSFQLDKDWFRKNLTDYDLWYIYYGEGYLRDTQSKVHTLRQGTCLLMKPGSIFEVWQKPGSKFSTRYFHFQLYDHQQQVVAPDTLDLPLIGDVSAYPHFDATTHRMSDLIAMDLQALEKDLLEQSQHSINAMLKGLLLDYLLVHRFKQVYTLNGVEDTHYNIAINLLSQIHENPAGFELDYYTQKLNYTPDHLRRIVKKTVGKTPHQLVIDAKIKRAKFLLHESDLSVGDIADQMGYANVHYFSLQFKQVTGSAPTVYRRQQQSNTNSTPE